MARKLPDKPKKRKRGEMEEEEDDEKEKEGVDVKVTQKTDEEEKREEEVKQQPIANDVLFALRRAQSQKPEEIYPLLEALAPMGKYLEIFARLYNLRNYWISLGLEI